MLCVEYSGLLGDGEGEAEDHEAEDQRDAAEHPRDDVDLLLQLLLRGLQQGLQVYSLYKSLQGLLLTFSSAPTSASRVSRTRPASLVMLSVLRVSGHQSQSAILSQER